MQPPRRGRHRRLLRRAGTLFFFAQVGSTVLAAGCRPFDHPRPLVLTSHPVGLSASNPGQRQVGGLVFRGGVEIESADPDFGGLSSLMVSADGRRFLAISDESHRISGSLEYRDGMLVAARGGTIAPLLAPDGTFLVGKDGDAEGMAGAHADDDFGDVFVSFEGEHRIWRYTGWSDGRPDAADPLPTNLPLPALATAAPPNEGLEALARIDKGRLLAVSEHLLDEHGNLRAWVLPFAEAPGEAVPGPDLALSIHAVPPFSVTDARLLEGGDLLLLERSYDPVQGPVMQMRRIAAGTLASTVASAAAGTSPPPLDGETLAVLNTDYGIDNMEGLAVRRGERGETLAYVVSDDNFHTPLQRTLLLLFEVTGGSPDRNGEPPSP